MHQTDGQAIIPDIATINHAIETILLEANGLARYARFIDDTFNLGNPFFDRLIASCRPT